ncbi:MAG: disulfide bond formation protein B [Simkaniaceae bacterium]|nr:disulfide bond formation protein B [Simkaniaceae bacterium]
MRSEVLFYNRIFILLACVAALILTASYCAEYIWKIVPCKLCRLQRLPYFALLICSIAGIFSQKKSY